MESLVDRLSIERLRRFGFSSTRIAGPLGAHQVFDGKGQGRLPTVILLHGFGSRSNHFVRLIRFLRPHVQRIVAPDLLGHGLSDPVPEGASNRDVANALFEALGKLLDEPAVVFGNSLGGLAGIRFALARPEGVSGLLVNSPGGAPLPAEEHHRFLERFRPRSLDDSRQLVGLAFARRPLLAELAAMNLYRRMSSPTVQRLLEQLRPEDMLSADELSGLSVPTRLLWGKAERVLLAEHLSFFRTHLPTHCEIEQPDGYGHVPYIEQAPDLARRIAEFAGGLLQKVAA